MKIATRDVEPTIKAERAGTRSPDAKRVVCHMVISKMIFAVKIGMLNKAKAVGTNR